MNVPAPSPPAHPTTSILSHLWRGTFLLAVRLALQVVIAFWSIPLVQHAIGPEVNGAYVFAWGFGFIQFLLELGMNTALQREMTRAWTQGDRAALHRLIGGGTTFYAIVGVLQCAIMAAVASLGIPPRFTGASRTLIVQLLWLQGLSAPFFGLLTVLSSVLQAARRYEFQVGLELIVTVLRFLVLVAGLYLGIPFIAIVVLQTGVQLAVMLAPALWVMTRKLDLFPHFSGARLADFAALTRVGFAMFLMQLSVVFADKLDTTVLGYALPAADVGHGITVYQNVSKPFVQIRQIGWTLAYLVMPTVASLAAANDRSGLERVKYDAPRLLVGALLPVVLLSWIYARLFLTVWVGPHFASYAPWLRLFLVATLPLALSVHAQMAIGLGRVEVVALSPFFGSLVNLPLSYYLTTKLGVPGVIWGTVLTTLIANFVIPGIYLFRLLDVRPAGFLTRTLGAPSAGVAGLLMTAWACSRVTAIVALRTSAYPRGVGLIVLLAACSLGYLAGYLAVPAGRRDCRAVVRHLGRTRHTG